MISRVLSNVLLVNLKVDNSPLGTSACLFIQRLFGASFNVIVDLVVYLSVAERGHEW